MGGDFIEAQTLENPNSLFDQDNRVKVDDFFLETLYCINHLTHACKDFGRGVLLLACMPCNAIIIPQNDELVPKTRSFAKESMHVHHKTHRCTINPFIDAIAKKI